MSQDGASDDRSPPDTRKRKRSGVYDNDSVGGNSAASRDGPRRHSVDSSASSIGSSRASGTSGRLKLEPPGSAEGPVLAATPASSSASPVQFATPAALSPSTLRLSQQLLESRSDRGPLASGSSRGSRSVASSSAARSQRANLRDDLSSTPSRRRTTRKMTGALVPTAPQVADQSGDVELQSNEDAISEGRRSTSTRKSSRSGASSAVAARSSSGGGRRSVKSERQINPTVKPQADGIGSQMGSNGPDVEDDTASTPKRSRRKKMGNELRWWAGKTGSDLVKASLLVSQMLKTTIPSEGAISSHRVKVHSKRLDRALKGWPDEVDAYKFVTAFTLGESLGLVAPFEAFFEGGGGGYQHLDGEEDDDNVERLRVAMLHEAKKAEKLADAFCEGEALVMSDVQDTLRLRTRDMPDLGRLCTKHGVQWPTPAKPSKGDKG